MNELSSGMRYLRQWLSSVLSSRRKIPSANTIFKWFIFPSQFLLKHVYSRSNSLHRTCMDLPFVCPCPKPPECKQASVKWCCVQAKNPTETKCLGGIGLAGIPCLEPNESSSGEEKGYKPRMVFNARWREEPMWELSRFFLVSENLKVGNWM